MHVDELLGKNQRDEVYFSKAFNLLAELIASANEIGLTKTYNLSLYFYLKPSEFLDLTKPNISALWNDFSHIPPELFFVERTNTIERGLSEDYESPIFLNELDKANTLSPYLQNIHAYYTCWISQENEDENKLQYERAVIIEYRLR